MTERARRAWWQRTATALADLGRDARFAGRLLVLVLAGVAGEAGQALARAARRHRPHRPRDEQHPTSDTTPVLRQR